MEVDLPDLAKRVRLYEVTLVVNVEAVVNRVILEVRDITSHVDCCHGESLMRHPWGHLLT
jgi:hypothetical protein